MKLPHAILVLMFAVLVPSFAAAAGGPKRLNDPAGDMWATGSRVPIYRALELPAVQAAMRDFDAQGYVRMPTLDGARSSGDTSIVCLAYQQPGVDIRLSMPMLVVFSTPTNLGPAIDVRGGIVERAADGRLRAGTGIGAHTVRVTSGGDLSTRATSVVVQSDPTTDRQWIEWIGCVFWYCVECLGIPIPVLGQILCCYIAALACHKQYVM